MEKLPEAARTCLFYLRLVPRSRSARFSIGYVSFHILTQELSAIPAHVEIFGHKYQRSLIFIMPQTTNLKKAGQLSFCVYCAHTHTWQINYLTLRTSSCFVCSAFFNSRPQSLHLAQTWWVPTCWADRSHAHSQLRELEPNNPRTNGFCLWWRHSAHLGSCTLYRFTRDRRT